MNGNYLPDVANQLAGQEIKSALVAAITAGTDPGEQTLGVVGPCAAGIAISGARLSLQVPSGSVTANDTNYTTLTVNKRTAGGAAVPIAAGSFKTTGGGGIGNLAANSSVVLPGVAGATVAPGDLITLTVTHGGGGVAVPASIVELFGSLN